MKRFYERFSESDPIVQQAVALLPWGHTLKLMQKFGDDNEAILYYAQETTAKGWSRDLLTSAISRQMHLRKNEPADNNFALTLPAAQASRPCSRFVTLTSCARTRPRSRISATQPPTNSSSPRFLKIKRKLMVIGSNKNAIFA